MRLGLLSCFPAVRPVDLRTTGGLQPVKPPIAVVGASATKDPALHRAFQDICPKAQESARQSQFIPFSGADAG